jgi:hypothetical protein
LGAGGALSFTGASPAGGDALTPPNNWSLSSCAGGRDEARLIGANGSGVSLGRRTGASNGWIERGRIDADGSGGGGAALVRIVRDGVRFGAGAIGHTLGAR